MAKRSDVRATEASGNGSPPAEVSEGTTAPAVRVEGRAAGRSVVVKTASFLAALFLFILSIQLMKVGAEAMAPRLQGTFPVDNMVSTMGLGWLGAYLVLSGSPVAAAALSLFAVGAVTRAQTFTMLTGSRLGASFIVLLVGFLYAVRSKNRRESIGMGVLALSMTAVVYVPGMLLGYGILKSGLIAGVQWHASAEINTVIDAVWGPIVDLAAGRSPPRPFF